MKNVILALCVIFIPFMAYAETTYDRVLRTGVIKCGYMLWLNAAICSGPLILIWILPQRNSVV